MCFRSAFGGRDVTKGRKAAVTALKVVLALSNRLWTSCIYFKAIGRPSRTMRPVLPGFSRVGAVERAGSATRPAQGRPVGGEPERAARRVAQPAAGRSAPA
jgi:hypothetical protein